MAHLLKFLLHFGEMQKKFIWKKFLQKIKKKFLNAKNKTHFFKNKININEIYPKNKWVKKFDKYWTPGEENALKELKLFFK